MGDRRLKCLFLFLLIGSMGFSWKSSEEYASDITKNKGEEQKAEKSKSDKSKKVTVGDIEVSYETYGSGYPIVLIMGYSGTKDFWSTYFIKTLAKSYKVITFDNRGMGLTTSGVKEFTIPQFADDTAGFMDAMGIQKVHVFSWSMGTNIALSLVTRYPQKVNKLILFAGDCGGPQAIQPTPENNAKLTDIWS